MRGGDLEVRAERRQLAAELRFGAVNPVGGAVVEQPLLGAKILMELVLMLSQRLRVTSSRVMELLDEKGQANPGFL